MQNISPNRLQNSLNRLYSAIKSNTSKKIANAFDRFYADFTSFFKNANTQIDGRANSNQKIDEIMKNCLVQNKYGDLLNPFDLKENDYKPEIFAESLSREMRFWNQTDLSVAEHCINMANLFTDNKELAKWAMIHEIYEAYTGDLATPYKACLPEYKIQENKALSFYAEKIGLDPQMPYEVHLADKRMMITEALKYMPDNNFWQNQAKILGEKEFGFPLKPYNLDMLKDEPLSPKDVRIQFARKWIELELPVTQELSNIANTKTSNEYLEEMIGECKVNNTLHSPVLS